MNRRRFLAASASAGVLSAADTRLLLPSDNPDDLGFRLRWYNPVPPINQATYRLKIHGLMEKPQSMPLADLRKLPQETQSARMKCVQCWSSRTTWSGFRFHHLLEAAKPTNAAHAVRIDCADKWYEYFTIEDLLSSRVLMVLDMAGETLAAPPRAPAPLPDPPRH